MTKFMAFITVMVCLIVMSLLPKNVLALPTPDIPLESDVVPPQNDAIETSNGLVDNNTDPNDLKPSETFGFGYYPGFYGGGLGGYGVGVGYGHGYGSYGYGYKRHWGYGSRGYNGIYGGYYPRPIYPVFG